MWLVLIRAWLLEFFFHKINVTPRLFGTLEYYVIDKTWFVTIPACLVVLLLFKQSSCRKQNWWVTKDKFLWQKSCAVSVRSRSLCALKHWLHFRELLYFFSARSSLGCTCSKFRSFEVLEASDRTIVRQKDLFGENSSCLPLFTFRKKALTHSIWQIQLWCPRSKWNMGEILAFLA